MRRTAAAVANNAFRRTSPARDTTEKSKQGIKTTPAARVAKQRYTHAAAAHGQAVLFQACRSQAEITHSARDEKKKNGRSDTMLSLDSQKYGERPSTATIAAA